MIKSWQKDLRDAANPNKIAVFMSFFKTGKGEYGEGDKFIGLSVPENRKITKKYIDADFKIIDEMLHHEIHEFRLSAFIALVEKFKKCKEVDSQKEIVDFYVSHGTCANNWDLVDLSAPYILGRYMVKNPMPQLLDKMSIDTNLWVQRIAIVSTLMLIRNNMFNDTLRLAQRYLSHPHPLIHKATGWMLREIGKRNETILLEFLDTHAPKMPRTALRYAIERLSSEQKQMYVQRK